MLRPVRRPLKPNWWTIAPVLASLALWGGILSVGAWTGSAANDRAERFAGISHAEEVVAANRN
jgi:hypothetical protein